MSAALKPGECPCGCNTILVRQRNGKRPLMCKESWAKMPVGLKLTLFSPHSLDDARREAARKLLDKANAIRAKRLDEQQLKLF